MPPTRFPYGRALGFANQFRTLSGTTAGNISGDSTPDVTYGELFYTNNTVATTITHFDLQNYAQRAAEYEGKIITVFFLDTATQIDNAGRLVLSSTDNLLGANNNITLMHSRSSWFELGRSYNNRSEVTNFTSIAGTVSINLDNVAVGIVVGTGATTISAFSGGQVGQLVTLMAGTGGFATSVATGGNILIHGTNAYLLGVSGAYQFVKRNGTQWTMLSVGTTGNP